MATALALALDGLIFLGLLVFGGLFYNNSTNCWEYAEFFRQWVFLAIFAVGLVIDLALRCTGISVRISYTSDEPDGESAQ